MQRVSPFRKLLIVHHTSEPLYRVIGTRGKKRDELLVTEPTDSVIWIEEWRRPHRRNATSLQHVCAPVQRKKNEQALFTREPVLSRCSRTVLAAPTAQWYRSDRCGVFDWAVIIGINVQRSGTLTTEGHLLQRATCT